MTAVLTPSVLVVSDDSVLVENVRIALGDTCRVQISHSADAAIKRVRRSKAAVAAVILDNQSDQAITTAAAHAIRQACQDIPLVAVAAESQRAGFEIDGCYMIRLPEDARSLIKLVRTGQAPAARSKRNTKARSDSHGTSEPAGRNSSAKPKTPATSTFLREEAARIENTNWFEATGPDGTRKLSGRILRLSPNFIVSELLDPQQPPAAGWSADDATVRLAGTEAYRGPARLTKLVNTGGALICEWVLEGLWLSAVPGDLTRRSQVLAPFHDRMRILGRISSVFKSVVAEVASVLEEARQCLDRLEAGIVPQAGESRAQLVQTILPELQRDLFPAFDRVFGQFEEASRAIPPELDASYHSLVRQRLHPLMMCAPFVHYVYSKPFGFAGDHGALQRLLQDPFEGQTLYAKLLNAWLILTPAGEAYRHRIQLLFGELVEQAGLCQQRGQRMRVLSIGCGAANEVTRFMERSDLSREASFTLVDFHAPALTAARQQTERARRTHGRETRLEYVCSSVHGIVLEDARLRRGGEDARGAIARPGGYDFVHCTGLFDYFSDRVCQRLLGVMSAMLAPGGRLIVCNFAPGNSIQSFMKYILDWNLIHRAPDELRCLLPAGLSAETRLSPGGTEAYLLCRRTY